MEKRPYIQIYWTAASLDEARAISRHLVESGIVACANIIPWIESVFLWNGELDVSQETKVIFKTKMERFDEVRGVIEERGKYEIPEILCLPIIKGNKEYLDWIDESV